MSLSKRFPNIVGSHTVSNTTRKGIPALQEALEIEGTRSVFPSPSLQFASFTHAWLRAQLWRTVTP
jgi:hypothetical protein